MEICLQTAFVHIQQMQSNIGHLLIVSSICCTPYFYLCFDLHLLLRGIFGSPAAKCCSMFIIMFLTVSVCQTDNVKHITSWCKAGSVQVGFSIKSAENRNTLIRAMILNQSRKVVGYKFKTLRQIYSIVSIVNKDV